MTGLWSIGTMLPRPVRARIDGDSSERGPRTPLCCQVRPVGGAGFDCVPYRWPAGALVARERLTPARLSPSSAVWARPRLPGGWGSFGRLCTGFFHKASQSTDTDESSEATKRRKLKLLEAAPSLSGSNLRGFRMQRNCALGVFSTSLVSS